MLQHLYIRDFAIVHKLDLELGAGLTVVTGETGAGKSIVIDALALALGERADAGVLRHDCTRTEVSASFTVKPSQEAAKWLKENDLFDDHECVLRRVIEADKPSKGFINGRPVPIQMLRELGEQLVDIHGQHEHQSLLKRDAQRQVLDDYAGLAEPVERLGNHYRTLSALTERLDALKRESADREARIELLRFQVRELEALNLAPDEMTLLEDEHARLAHGAQLLEGAQTAAQIIYDDEETATAQQLARAVARLETLSEFDPRLGEVAALLNEAAIQVDEAAARLHHYLDSLELDPARLEWLDRRIGTAHDLARKHRVKPAELPDVRAHLATELGDIENFDAHLAKLEQDIAAERGAYAKLAADVSKERKIAAAKLATAVTARMQELGMPGGKFEIALSPLSEGEFGAHGLERIEFLVSANPGQPAKALAKVASGGELSRISLALQVVTAAIGRIPTLIFDEVDVGVGGRVAEIVGQQLRALGKSRQVFCITHLAQVAALGENHLRVVKRAQEQTTLAEVQTLDENARVQEIARMIGGIEISKQTLAHAQDMLARASA
jgi:DNA repair protein RecN (Recombination protein N)